MRSNEQNLKTPWVFVTLKDLTAPNEHELGKTFEQMGKMLESSNLEGNLRFLIIVVEAAMWPGASALLTSQLKKPERLVRLGLFQEC